MLAAAAAKAAAKAAASAKAAQVCPYCQGFGHSRKTSKQCRLYRAPAPQSPAGDAASIAGAVPAAAGVEAWTLNDNAGALRLVMYNEFRNSVFDQVPQPLRQRPHEPDHQWQVC